MDSNSLVNIFEQKGLSANIQMLLSSEEYYQALDECYGSDSRKKNVFTASLIAEDIAARTTGVLYAAGVYYLTGKFLLALSTYYPTLGKILLVSATRNEPTLIGRWHRLVTALAMLKKSWILDRANSNTRHYETDQI